jgi:hypothetical protein
MALTASPEFSPIQSFMNEYWTALGGFPPVTQPARLVTWLLDVHLGDRIFAVPFGAENGAGIVTLVCCAGAAFIMWRRGQRSVVTIFLAMFVLAFVAATLERYPYGGHFRLMQFLVPGICITAGLGIAALLGRVSQVNLRVRLATGLMLLLALFGAGVCARDCVHPYHYALDEEHRSFARWFWRQEPASVTICCQADLGRTFWQNGCDCYYRCNQRIYSPPHHASRKLATEAELKAIGERVTAAAAKLGAMLRG